MAPRTLEGLVSAELARALLAQGKTEAARVQADAAAVLIDGIEATYYRLPASIHIARVRGDLPALEDAASEARRLGFVAFELEARLAQAELNPRRAATIVRDARRRGSSTLHVGPPRCVDDSGCAAARTAVITGAAALAAGDVEAAPRVQPGAASVAGIIIRGRF